MTAQCFTIGMHTIARHEAFQPGISTLKSFLISVEFVVITQTILRNAKNTSVTNTSLVQQSNRFMYFGTTFHVLLHAVAHRH